MKAEGKDKYAGGPQGITTVMMRRFRRQMSKRAPVVKLSKRKEGREQELEFDLRRQFNLREMSDDELTQLEEYVRNRTRTGEEDG